MAKTFVKIQDPTPGYEHNVTYLEEEFVQTEEVSENVGKSELGNAESVCESGTSNPNGQCAVLLQPGKKLDNGKSPIHQGVFQYFPRALLEVGKISKYGAEKYELDYNDINWARVDGGIGRYGDARGRHILGEFIDGPIDPESGLLHAAMAAWNALAYLELVLKEKNNNGTERSG